MKLMIIFMITGLLLLVGCQQTMQMDDTTRPSDDIDGEVIDEQDQRAQDQENQDQIDPDQADQNQNEDGQTIDATVEMANLEFVPQTIRIQAGDTVQWINTDSVIHTVTGPGFDVTLRSGETYTHTFNEEGRIDYVCTIHPGMEGTIIVEASPTEEDTTSPIQTEPTNTQSQTENDGDDTSDSSIY